MTAVLIELERRVSIRGLVNGQASYVERTRSAIGPVRAAALRVLPGAQQRAESFHGGDVDLAKAVAVPVAGVFAAP